jgi:hypothetical protein
MQSSSKAIAQSIKTTDWSDRTSQNPTYSKAQKLPNGKAIAILAKTTPSDRP